MQEWYPNTKEELKSVLEEFLSQKTSIKQKQIHGLIVPHAGYAYSGKIAGKAFSLIKNLKNKKAVILGPSHYAAFNRVAVMQKTETPLGKIKIPENNFPKLQYEHSVDNQIPFLQKLGFTEILPLVIGQISLKDAEEIAKMLIKNYPDYIYIFSTDLSHFFEYETAVKKDKNSIDIITNTDESKLNNLDACGFYPLLILLQLCKLKSWKPELIEYKNSGDITGDKSQVVGYACLYF